MATDEAGIGQFRDICRIVRDLPSPLGVMPKATLAGDIDIRYDTSYGLPCTFAVERVGTSTIYWPGLP